MNLANATVSIAPVGTSPTDHAAWTPLGFTDGELHFEPADADDIPLFYGDDWPKTATITMPMLVARQVLALYQPLQCRDARHRIEEAGRRWRVARLLAAALAQPVVLPCPRPF
ncbi:hypothetical protein ACFC07_22010 [Streptomyces sp. NPDC056099]|uniref:hypothetical protein n=1 Tax=unclassified Streptomyces TaxID=2593676 RepID=UPI0035D8D118